MEHSGQFIRKEPCPNCGSRDNVGRWSDGHAYCFGCFYRESGDGEVKHTPRKIVSSDLKEYLEAEVQPLTARGITEETCRHWGVRVGTHKGKKAHFYPYYRDGELVGCKVRGPEKTFSWIGEAAPGLFGQHLWGSGKKIVVCEGEVDALSISAVQSNRWPVVSIPNGAQSAKKSLAKSLEYFNGFEEVILMFDMDEPGQKAAKECAGLFQVGKCKIATLPYKDANECLMKGKPDAIIQAIWNAKPYRPDGIVAGTDLWERLNNRKHVESYPYPWLGVNDKTKGMRKGELVTFTAGSGVGKSAVVRELAYHLLKQGETVGMIMLEESIDRTADGLIGIHLSKPIHIDRDTVSDDEYREAYDATVGSGKVFMYDHFGSTAIENLLEQARYLAVGCGCKWIVLDHLSIVVSGLGDGDERRLIDKAMTDLRSFVQATGVGMLLVSHLRRPEGKGHEEGAHTSLSQLRGSHSIAQLSDMVIGLERDQQSQDKANETVLRVLKNRFSGETGVACTLHYNRETGRLTESPIFDMGEVPF